MEQQIFTFISGLSHQSVIADNFAILVARYVPYLLVIGFFVLLADIRGGRRRTFFLVFAAMTALLGRGIITEGIRFFYDRPRPFELLGFEPLVSQSALEPAFPSGHAAFFFGLAVVVWYMSRTWGIWYAAFAALNGFARVFAGIHWPLDIIAGAAVGICSAFVVRSVLSPHEPHTKEHSSGEPPLEPVK